MVNATSTVCEPGGYLSQQGYDITLIQALIPRLQRLLSAFRSARFQVYHTREGHRPDLSTLSGRERFRSLNHTAPTAASPAAAASPPTSLGVGSRGPLGRLLVRGEPGHDIVAELYPRPDEPVIDKPGKGAFAYTDFELLLRNRGIRNLVVAGVTADVCVSSTVREACDRGFDVLVLEDGMEAADEGLAAWTCRSHRMEGGVFGAVGRVEGVVTALEELRTADSGK